MSTIIAFGGTCQQKRYITEKNLRLGIENTDIIYSKKVKGELRQNSLKNVLI